MGYWSIDGVEWSIPCAIKRIVEVKKSETSGMMMNKSFFNDVLGSYISYEIGIAVPRGMESQYYQVFELLSHPIGSHTFVMPYNGDVIEFDGCVDDLSDEWVRRINGNLWKGVRFKVVGNTPYKEVDEDELVAYGISPYPDSSESADVGDTYQLTDEGWVKYNYVDGDEEYW